MKYRSGINILSQEKKEKEIRRSLTYYVMAFKSGTSCIYEKINQNILATMIIFTLIR